MSPSIRMEVVSLARSAISDSENPLAHCTISLTDGRTLAVIESCAEVFKELNGK
jgi:hypothetical protein